MTGAANQMNIQAAYSDIDLDANQMETQFRSSLQHVLCVVCRYLFEGSKTHNTDK